MDNQEIEGILEHLLDDFRKLESGLNTKQQRSLSVDSGRQYGAALPPSREAYLLNFMEAVVSFEINKN